MRRSLFSALIISALSCSALAEDQDISGLKKWHSVNFESEPQLNMHLFLYELARDEDLYDTLKDEGGLSFEEQALFDHAISEYRKYGANKNIHILRSDSEIADLTALLLVSNPVGPDSVDNILYARINEISIIYKTKLWKLHHERNLKWYLDLKSKLDIYGDTISSSLEALFDEKLVADEHTVNIVYKPGMRQGATTSGRSFQTVINSTYPDYSDWYALEMFFHEISHANSVGRNSKLQQIISTEFSRLGLDNHKGIWHPIQFYTVGEVVKKVISKDVSEYVPYAEVRGLYTGRWDYKMVLDQNWKPYLDGEVSMETAVENIASALSKKGG
ncbi:hypothetical protein BTJ40_18625 [Microbulbifer sp. A4B17]|uniref:hypothetical protein n=1 Tax=Microbulbifer sp. A4B17 TaxID=359370 RepID=UPI000D52E617|nr:hypothetical protein [Microbulbifer sp. A4B17]AWF82662.1 hypothetical protein BTJ40_18625 [Microbulbifer sp. A4B17]